MITVICLAQISMENDDYIIITVFKSAKYRILDTKECNMRLYYYNARVCGLLEAKPSAKPQTSALFRYTVHEYVSNI